MTTLSKSERVIRLIGITFACAVMVGYFASLHLKPPKTPDELRFDEELSESPRKSVDLASDIEMMWKTVPLHEFSASPVSAINAAGRVFETIEPVGKSTNEVFAIIGNNKTSNDSAYNFPFWPVEQGTLVYRFDCGYFGWQFNLIVDSSGHVTNVEKKWIH